jgi:hypothetical protein
VYRRPDVAFMTAKHRLLQFSNTVDSSVILVLALLRHLESRHGSDGQLPVQAELRQLCVKLLASPELKVSRSGPSIRNQQPTPIVSLV